MSFLSQLLPGSIKEKLSKIIQHKIVEPTLRFRFGGLYDNQTSIIKYMPFKRDQDYVIPDFKKQSGGKIAPPFAYWLGYGKTEQEYLESGVEDVKKMDANLATVGYTERTNQKVLDLGCGCARMLRNVNQHFKESELWGLDIDAKLIYWCKENIGETANYATTTLIPHLPFESNYFNLIYCGSVFTHIDDLADAWLLEVRRVLKKDGIFYVTIHDENTVKMLDGEYKNANLAEHLFQNKTYMSNKSNFGMMVIDRDNLSQVFFSKAYFKQWVEPFFELVQIIDGAYGYQSVAVLRKK